MKTFEETLNWRRSNYDLTPTIPFDDQTLETILRENAEKAPSPFNMQNARLVLLLGEQHKKLWQIVKDTLRPIVNNEEAFQQTEKKLDGFANGYGTILYFHKNDVVKNMQEQVPAYAENFPRWGEHANGALLYGTWLTLASHGIAANIQHYNPLIDEDVKKTFHIDDTWELIGQMPFGLPASLPEPRTSVSDMLTVLK